MFKADDSSFCGVALLGFAIQINNLTAMCAGDNQREQGKGLGCPSPCPLGFLPRAPSFLTHTHLAGVGAGRYTNDCLLIDGESEPLRRLCSGAGEYIVGLRVLSQSVIVQF